MSMLSTDAGNALALKMLEMRTAFTLQMVFSRLMQQAEREGLVAYRIASSLVHDIAGLKYGDVLKEAAFIKLAKKLGRFYAQVPDCPRLRDILALRERQPYQMLEESIRWAREVLPDTYEERLLEYDRGLFQWDIYGDITLGKMYQRFMSTERT